MVETEKELLQVISYPEKSAQFVHTRFDDNCAIDSPLNLISKNSEAGKLKLYFYSKKNHLQIWLTDEVGAIGYGEQIFDNKQAVLRTYQIFLSCIANRQKIASPEQFLYQVEYYDLSTRLGAWKAKEMQMLEPHLPIHYYPVQALIEEVTEDSSKEDLRPQQITIYCDERRFSGLDDGENMFKKIAAHVKDLRNKNSEYPIYITDLDLSALHQYGPCSTIRYLEYKWQLEKQLNQALD